VFDCPLRDEEPLRDNGGETLGVPRRGDLEAELAPSGS
jgi:hypothetical protein